MNHTDAHRRHDPDVRSFASDNYAGVHPEVLAALALANGGHQVAYGDDAYTENLQDIIRDHFGASAEAFPVFNGTGANVVALQAVTEGEALNRQRLTARALRECGQPRPTQES